jgi:hypothetical protein
MDLKVIGGPFRGPLGGVQCGLLLVFLTMLLACSREPPKSAADELNTPAAELLKQLTAVDEAERFAVLDRAKERIGHIDVEEVEDALTALRPKNVSTLIYVCIQVKSRLLFGLPSAAQKALEHSAGSFPNLAYYLARVDSDIGLPVLLDLYERHPAHRMAICLAIGETCHPKAVGFLLEQARRIKITGGEIVAHLAGLKHSCRGIDRATVDWLLTQELTREETIALSELALDLPPERLRTLWQAGGRRRFLAVEIILGAPLAHFETLRWMVDQYLMAGDKNTVRQLMHSDGLRSVSDERLIEFRESTLAKIPLKRRIRCLD